MDAPVVYHLTTLKEWEDAQDKGSYEPPSLIHEGFIHCSTDEQIEGVISRLFKGHQNLVKLVIDPKRLLASLRYDFDEEQKQEFPHIYGPLNLEAVTQIVFLDPISSED